MIGKRPIVVLTLLYGLFLWTVLVAFPSTGEVIFRFHQRQEQLKEKVQGTFSVEGVVLSVASAETSHKIRVKFRFEHRFYQAILIVKEKRLLVCQSGDRIWFSGKAFFAESPMNPGEFDGFVYAKCQNIDLYVIPDQIRVVKHSADPVFLFFSRTRDAAKTMLTRLYEKPYAGILTAMLLGDRSGLSEEEKDLFSEGGIDHVLAISGLHLSILSDALRKLLERKLSPRRSKMIVGSFVWLYTLWCGSSVATIRAAIMLTTNSMAGLLDYDKDEISAVFLAMLILLIKQPLYLKYSGFWFTFAALFGIRYGRLLLIRIRWIPYPLRSRMAPSFGVALFTLPVSLWFCCEVNILSFFLNLLVIPLVGVLLISAIVSLLLGTISTTLAFYPALVCKAILSLFRSGADTVGSFPLLRLTGRPQIYQILFGIVVFLIIRRMILGTKSKSTRIIQGGVSACLVILMLFPVKTSRVAFLAVGQGDAAVIELNGSVAMIDAGPSYDQVIKPYLKFRGIQTIDCLVISHPDTDHIEGAIRLSEDPEFRVRSVVVSGADIQETEEMKTFLENAAMHDTKVLRIGSAGNLSINKRCILHVYPPDLRTASINDSSLVVSFEGMGIRFLMTGDISSSEEALLLESESLQTDVLKIAHHGSRYSSSDAFLEAVRPKLAVISCGKYNRYGHPSKEVLEKLDKNGIEYRITSFSGAIWIEEGREGQILYKQYIKP